MAEFKPEKKLLSDFNNGVKYVDYDPLNNITGDGVQAETVNNLVESVLYSQSRAETAVATSRSAQTVADEALSKIDQAISKGVTSVNGKAGDVTITAEELGAVKKSGDTMTGALEVPLILGKGAGAIDYIGIVPVRYITRTELGISSSDSVDAYIQAWLKKVCELYPDHSNCTFVGSGNPSSRMMICALIYNTSEVDSNGMPRYAIGISRQFTLDIIQFDVNEYKYSSFKSYSPKNRPTAESFQIGVHRTNQTDTVVEYHAIINGKAWYRKWASGFIEQGGTITTNNNATTNITFYPAFSTALLSLTSSYLTSKARDNPMVVREYSLTGFTVSNKAGTDDTAVSWYACGY